ncbi:thiol:disulfide interchange protein, partial [Shewanella algae]
MQSPIFVVLLAWLFFVLSVQMLGYFEFEWLNPNWGSGLLKHQGATSAFFTGVLAVVVASPCTAPFMGAAIGVALSQSLGILL